MANYKRGPRITDPEERRVPLKKRQFDRFTKHFPDGSGFQSKAVQRALDLLIDAADEYGDEFILSIILDKKEYKIVKK